MDLKTINKNWYFAIVVVVFGGMIFGIYQYHKYQAREALLKRQSEENGDGRYKAEISKMSKQSIEDLSNSINWNDCNAFVFYATARNVDSHEIQTLDLSLKSRIYKICSGLQGVSAESVWEGMKEINSLVPQYQDFARDYIDSMGSASNNASVGNQEELGKEAEANNKDPNSVEKNIEDTDQDLQNRMGNSTDQINYISSKMDQIAALVLRQVPKNERQALLMSLKAIKGVEPTSPEI